MVAIIPITLVYSYALYVIVAELWGKLYMKCWVCNEELVWGGDHDLEEDETHFGGHTMITNLSCPNESCNAFVEVYHGSKSNE